jgi:trehalose-6-phosphate hydrolase
VVNLISKDQDFPNDPDGDGRRFYTDGPRAHAFLREMNRDVFTPRGLMTVGEMSHHTGKLPAVRRARWQRTVDDL